MSLMGQGIGEVRGRRMTWSPTRMNRLHRMGGDRVPGYVSHSFLKMSRMRGGQERCAKGKEQRKGSQVRHGYGL